MTTDHNFARRIYTTDTCTCGRSKADHRDEQGRQQRRRTAAENLLESEGIKPKRAAKLAAALLDTLEEVQ